MKTAVVAAVADKIRRKVAGGGSEKEKIPDGHLSSRLMTSVFVVEFILDKLITPYVNGTLDVTITLMSVCMNSPSIHIHVRERWSDPLLEGLIKASPRALPI